MLTLEALTKFLWHSQRNQVCRNKDVVNVTLVCIPTAWNINREDFALERNKLIDEILVRLSDLPLERKTKYCVHDHGPILQMLFKILLDRLLLILKIGVWIMCYPI